MRRGEVDVAERIRSSAATWAQFQGELKRFPVEDELKRFLLEDEQPQKGYCVRSSVDDHVKPRARHVHTVPITQNVLYSSSVTAAFVNLLESFYFKR